MSSSCGYLEVWIFTSGRRTHTLVTVCLIYVSLFMVVNFKLSSVMSPEGFTVRSKRLGDVTRYSSIKKGDVSWLKSPEDFFYRLQQEQGQTHCRKLVALGGFSCARTTDGAKLMCLDPDVVIHPRDCTVYSFGVHLEISFDNHAAEYGCSVFMLDPTLPKGAYSELTGKQKFYPIGLHGQTGIITMALKNYPGLAGLVNATVATFDDVQKFIGHHGPVPYLKIDIEGSEWSALEHMMDHDLLKGIRQIAVEIHDRDFTKMPLLEAVEHMKQRWRLLERLQDHGFLRVRYDPTPSTTASYRIPGTRKIIQTCGELFLVRRSAVRVE